MRATRIFAATIFALGLAASANATTVSLTVAGTGDIWLAGMAAGARASSLDIAGEQSPFEVNGLTLHAGSVLRFGATGSVSNTPTCPCYGPDGGEIVTHYAAAENGFSTVFAPLSSLVGVFLSDSAPNLGDAPSGLNFGADGLGIDFASLAPQLQQVFFIGDGTANGMLQNFIIPVGATRLFLGTMDGFEWGNNIGEFHVNVITNPEPATLILLGTGLLGAARLRRRR